MARQFSNPFPPARPRRAPKRVLSQASVAGDAHEQRAADEVAAAVLAVGAALVHLPIREQALPPRAVAAACSVARLARASA